MKFDFKNASKEELREKYQEIATRFGNNQFFTKKELAYLPAILREGEQVIAFTSGLMDGNSWLITLTDKRIIFLDKGMFFGFCICAFTREIRNKKKRFKDCLAFIKVILVCGLS